jgi:hypothetical protein
MFGNFTVENPRYDLGLLDTKIGQFFLVQTLQNRRVIHISTRLPTGFVTCGTLLNRVFVVILNLKESVVCNFILHG